MAHLRVGDRGVLAELRAQRGVGPAQGVESDPLGDRRPAGGNQLLEAAPDDEEPITPEEDEGAREARAELVRGEVYSAEEIKLEIS